MVKKVLKNINFKIKKNLGQNFIFDENWLKIITKLTNVKENSTIIEIGTGYGNLTNFLIKENCKKIISIEKDKQLYQFNKEKKIKNLILINDDALKINWKKMLIEEQNVILTGNLPYYLSKKLIAKLIIEEIDFEKMIFLVQEEVGLKIISEKNNEKTSLGTFLQTFCEIKKLKIIPKMIFCPKPSVNGILIELKNKENNIFLEKNIDKKKFIIFLKTIFSKKRKTIYNNLIKNYEKKSNDKTIHDLLNELKIDKNIRIQDLKNHEILNLFKNCQKIDLL